MSATPNAMPNRPFTARLVKGRFAALVAKWSDGTWKD